MFLTVSIPAYNDSDSLKELVESCISHLNSLKIDYNILLIDDGSTDRTNDTICLLKQQYSCIEHIQHTKNLGFGKTLSKVFLYPNSEWILFLPGDNQFPIENINRFLPFVNDFDFMIGFRKKRMDKFNRKLYSYFYNSIVSIVSGYEVNDVNSIVFFKKAILNDIVLNSNSAFIHAELYIKVAQKAARIIEIDVKHNKRQFGVPSGGKFRVMFHTLYELFLFTIGKLN